MSGAADEPVEGVRPVIQEQVSGIRHEVEFGVREACGKVFAVGARYQYVQVALPEPHLSRHVGKLEAPGRCEREVVVDPAAASLADRLDEGAPALSPGPRGGRAWPGRERGAPRQARRAAASGSLLIVSTCGSRRAVMASSPARAAPNSSRFTSAMPSRKSKAGSSDGAAPTRTAALVTRFGRSAAHARVWGPPPETPMSAKRSSPR